VNAFRRLSITARITIGSAIVAVVFGLVAVVGVRLGVSALQHNATVTLLKHDTAPFTETLENHPDQALGTPGESQAIAIVDPSGTVKVSTLPRSLRPRADVLAAAKAGDVHTVATANAEYLTYVAKVETPAGTWRVVSARNQDANALVLDRLSVALIIGAGVLVVGFAFASYILARTALRPVNSMRLQADRLAAGRSDELLPLAPARDELHALATTLNNLIGQLRASADRERQMVSDASHELRTPLAILQGELELAELDAGDPNALLRDIRSSHSAVLRLSQLARNLLELSRIEAATIPGHANWRELTDELADAIDRARSLAPDRDDGEPLSIDFDYSPRDAGDGSVALSPPEFGRILDNLLGNAIAALSSQNDAGPGSITAALTRTPTAVRIVITDSGPGMSEDFVPVAFDRFTRADASRGSHGATGGGLGLAIVAALVSSANGSIQLSKAPEGGLGVLIELPLLADAADQDATHRQAESA
jgi:signal transduction histidine kinase